MHFNGLVRALDLAPGQVQHHLKALLASDGVVAESLLGRTHYFPDGFDDWDRRALALLRRETARDIVVVLLDTGPASPSTVVDRLGIARSTLEWHLDRLEAVRLVEKTYDDRQHVTLDVARPQETAALLGEADPTLLQTLADRYTRLVDRLLAD